MKRLLMFGAPVVFVAAIAVLPASAQVKPEDHEAHHPAPPAAATPAPAPAPGRPMQGAPMMAGMEKMMAEMKATNADLEHLLTRMNAATGDDKVAVMAELVTLLARRQATMCEHMMQMHAGMMGK